MLTVYKFSECNNSDETNVVLKRSSGHKRYYSPQFQHLPQIAAARILKKQPSLKEQHSLREQALRAGQKTQTSFENRMSGCMKAQTTREERDTAI